MKEAEYQFSRLLLDRIEKAVKRKWARNSTGHTISRDGAIEYVKKVFSDQMRKENIHSSMTAYNFFLGALCVGDYFESLFPTQDDIYRVSSASNHDFYAYMAMEFIEALNRNNHFEALNEWNRRKYLGLAKCPRRPAGPDRYKELHRNMIIVSQIKQLEACGFFPTRNDATATRDSGCDIVQVALAHIGINMSYDALVSIWKKRNNIPKPTMVSDLIIEYFTPQP